MCENFKNISEVRNIIPGQFEVKPRNFDLEPKAPSMETPPVSRN